MKMSLNGKDEATKWEFITLDNGDTFEVKLKRPGTEDHLKRHAHHVAVARSSGADAVQAQMDSDVHAIQSAIVDWRGVLNEETDNAVPFSHKRLFDLMSQANCTAKILNIAYSAYGSAFSETPAKNSEGPRGEHSVAAK